MLWWLQEGLKKLVTRWLITLNIKGTCDHEEKSIVAQVHDVLVLKRKGCWDLAKCCWDLAGPLKKPYS